MILAGTVVLVPLSPSLLEVREVNALPVWVNDLLLRLLGIVNPNDSSQLLQGPIVQKGPPSPSSVILVCTVMWMACPYLVDRVLLDSIVLETPHLPLLLVLQVCLGSL